MKRMNSDSRVAGFSLIEAMATLALPTTIILAHKVLRDIRIQIRW
jgi:hypothetical protein